MKWLLRKPTSNVSRRYHAAEPSRYRQRIVTRLTVETHRRRCVESCVAEWRESRALEQRSDSSNWYPQVLSQVQVNTHQSVSVWSPHIRTVWTECINNRLFFYSRPSRLFDLYVMLIKSLGKGEGNSGSLRFGGCTECSRIFVEL